jgi:hypothetical protein
MLKMNVIDQGVDTLLSYSGLEPEDARTAVYYAAATWGVDQLDMFPIFPLLRFYGPPGTGKSRAMKVLASWCCRPRTLSGKRITVAALRDELAKAYQGTALIEEADETADDEGCEQLLAARCETSTAELELKVKDRSDTWHQVPVRIYGATVVHYRRAFIDQAIASRSININTRGREGSWQTPIDIPELLPLRNLAKIELLDYPVDFVPDGRVKDVWVPLLRIARMAKDKAWLEYAKKKMMVEIEDLRDGNAYEEAGLVLAQILQSLTKKKDNLVVCRQLTVQDDIIEPLRQQYRRYIHPWQASKQLKELGFKLERIGGKNKFTPTPESLKRAAQKIGYEDSLLL